MEEFANIKITGETFHSADDLQSQETPYIQTVNLVKEIVESQDSIRHLKVCKEWADLCISKSNDGVCNSEKINLEEILCGLQSESAKFLDCLISTETTYVYEFWAGKSSLFRRESVKSSIIEQIVKKYSNCELHEYCSDYSDVVCYLLVKNMYAGKVFKPFVCRNILSKFINNQSTSLHLNWILYLYLHSSQNIIDSVHFSYKMEQLTKLANLELVTNWGHRGKPE